MKRLMSKIERFVGGNFGLRMNLQELHSWDYKPIYNNPNCTKHINIQ